MTTTWFTSDWHLGHRNILQLGRGRPFDTIAEHDAQLIHRHNALVDDRDPVWVLGDVAMGDIAVSLALCAQMKGRKILVCGNHDRPAMTNNPDKRGAWTARYINEGGFAGALLAEPATTVRLPDNRLVRASHYPYRGDSGDEDRFADRRPVDDGGWLLHGHVHHSWRVSDRQINVGVDAWDYEPVPARRIMELMDAGTSSV